MIDKLAINEYSSTPKFEQIVNAVLQGLANTSIRIGDRLPSINEFSAAHDVARGTVEKAYVELKRRGIIQGVPGKGFYITAVDGTPGLRVFLLFNKLSAHKKIIYDHFTQTLGDQAQIDFFVYHNEFRIFKRLLEQQGDAYTHYVIIPHFFAGEDKALELIDQLPRHKLLLLDKRMDALKGPYASVYQPFDRDIQQALQEALPLLEHYNGLNIIFPPYTYHPRAILHGFQEFCIDNHISGRIVPDMEKELIRPNEVYISLMEDDLVDLIKKIKDAGMQSGKDVGILSYNENPLKEILLDGISVMSTDFAAMGRKAAQMLLEGDMGQHANPFHLILRKSL